MTSSAKLTAATAKYCTCLQFSFIFERKAFYKVREAVGTLRLMMVFNWHAILRMPGSEPSFSLACQGFPTHSHTHKAQVLLFPPFYTSHRLMLQNTQPVCQTRTWDVAVSHPQACIGLFQTRNVPGVLGSALFTRLQPKQPIHGLGKGSLTNPG